MVGLTSRQQAFVDAYQGNGTLAAKAAGYQGSPQTLAETASRLLKHAKVRQALEHRRLSVEARAADAVAAQRIATRTERQAFWTQVMLDVSAKMADRLKAAELLGRSEADFTENLKVDARVTLEQLLEKAGR